MNILIAASEAVPFAKTGGLGDVMGALPRALARQGHQIKMFLPRYQNLDFGSLQPRPFGQPFTVNINSRKAEASLEWAPDKKLSVEYCFVANEHYFNRPELYRDPATGKDYVDNDERFVFFCRAIIESVKKAAWRPDIIHVHDWQAGLVAAYLKTAYKDDPFFASTKTVLTVHNLAYQGTFPRERFATLGLDKSLFYPTSAFEFYDQVNFLKAAIVYADKITTVSPRYAQEIQTSEHGAGLDGVLRNRRSDISGILNGVDYTVWSPSRDRLIPYNYHPANLSGKRMNKVELLNRAGLPVRDQTPLIGVISRLADQKGFDLVAEAAADIFALDLQMIVLGTGEEKYHRLFTELEQKYPDKLKVYLKFDEALAHQIEAGSDMFLMPSHYEPCGLNQMYSLKYGTIPIVRYVGGLADTVIDFDENPGSGSGFVFHDYKAEAMVLTIQRTLKAFSHRRHWTKIVKTAMKQDFSWDKSARQYADFYAGLPAR